MLNNNYMFSDRVSGKCNVFGRVVRLSVRPFVLFAFLLFCIFDLINFTLFMIKFVTFKPVIKFIKFECHNNAILGHMFVLQVACHCCRRTKTAKLLTSSFL